MKRKFIILALVLLGLILAGLAWSLWGKKPFLYAGTVEATRIDLPARVATIVEAVHVTEGMKVTAGQLLVSLACEEVRIAARLASENFERAERLKKSGSISNEAYDQIRSRRQESDTRLSWCEIKAPVDGTVLTRYLEPGEWASPGAKVLSVADLNNLWVYFYVPQEMMARLSVGARVKGLVPELGEQPVEGVITKISEEAEFTPKNVQTRAERTRLVFGVKVAFRKVGTLKPGMTVEAEF